MDAARNAYIRAAEFAPGLDGLAFSLATLDLLQGQPSRALAHYERISLGWMRLTGIALAQHDLGHTKEAQEALDEIGRKDAGSYAPYQSAEVYAHRLDLDRAFEWLERAYVFHDTGLTLVKSDPLLRNLRGDPRYRALLKKMNLPVD